MMMGEGQMRGLYMLSALMLGMIGATRPPPPNSFNVANDKTKTSSSTTNAPQADNKRASPRHASHRHGHAGTEPAAAEEVASGVGVNQGRSPLDNHWLNTSQYYAEVVHNLMTKPTTADTVIPSYYNNGGYGHMSTRNHGEHTAHTVPHSSISNAPIIAVSREEGEVLARAQSGGLRGSLSNQLLYNLVCMPGAFKDRVFSDLEAAMPCVLPVLNGFFRQLGLRTPEWQIYGIPGSLLVEELVPTGKQSPRTSDGGADGDNTLRNYSLLDFEKDGKTFNEMCWEVKMNQGRPKVVYSRCNFNDDYVAKVNAKRDRPMPFYQCDISLEWEPEAIGAAAASFPSTVYAWREFHLKCWYEYDANAAFSVSVNMRDEDEHVWSVHAPFAIPHPSQTLRVPCKETSAQKSTSAPMATGSVSSTTTHATSTIGSRPDRPSFYKIPRVGRATLAAVHQSAATVATTKKSKRASELQSGLSQSDGNYPASSSTTTSAPSNVAAGRPSAALPHVQILASTPTLEDYPTMPSVASLSAVASMAMPPSPASTVAPTNLSSPSSASTSSTTTSQQLLQLPTRKR